MEAVAVKKPLAEHLTRQLDLLPLECLGEPITIIGAGAVGGWTALALTKMGFENVSVWDPDTVSVENLNCQFFRHRDVGEPKVGCLIYQIQDYSNIGISGYLMRYEGERAFPGIVISAVDNMATRRLIWEAHLGSPLTRAIIDPRMGAETALLYVMKPSDPDDCRAYEKTLYSDDNAVREPCTRKSTAYCALPLAGLVAAQVKALVTGSQYSRITQWDIPKGAFVSYQKGVQNENETMANDHLRAQ